MNRICLYARGWPLLGLLVLGIGAFTGCAGGGQTSGEDPDVITQEQIQNAGSVSNAYLLVQRLHPDWLQKRGANSLRNPSDVVVYVEGSQRGGPEALRNIDLVHVKAIRHLDSNEATLQYGTGHDHGVIQVEFKER